MRQKKRIAFTVLLLLVTICGAGVYAYCQGAFLPAWIAWQSREIVCEDHRETVRVTLANRSICVQADGDTIWTSENGILVQDCLWGDIDHDGEAELMLLCWRRGRYGKSRPFWVERDEIGWSQHIYIYDWTSEGARPRWMASDIGMDVTQWQYDAVERLRLTNRKGEVTAWDWVGWGLQRWDGNVSAQAEEN